MTFLPVEKHQRLQCEGILERIVREEGLTVLGWRDTPGLRVRHWPRGARFAALHPADFCAAVAPGMDEDAFERKLYVVRKRAENEIARVRHRRRGDVLHPFALVPHHRLQRPAAGPADRQFLPRALRSRRDQRAVPGAPALFDQHVSQLAAGASLPLHRAQRRDQHAPRQRELDARAPVAAAVAAVRRRHEEAVSHHRAATAAIPRTSTTPWNCCCRRDAACRT